MVEVPRVPGDARDVSLSRGTCLTKIFPSRALDVDNNVPKGHPTAVHRETIQANIQKEKLNLIKPKIIY